MIGFVILGQLWNKENMDWLYWNRNNKSVAYSQMREPQRYVSKTSSWLKCVVRGVHEAAAEVVGNAPA